MQIQLFEQNATSLQNLRFAGRSCIELEYCQKVWSENESAEILRRLISEIQWRIDQIRMFGKLIPLPRMTAWYGDDGAIYSYSGIKNTPQQWNAITSSIRTKVEQLTREEFNSVLLNRYRSGTDHMSWHSDDEPELGSEPTIASVSFGKTRIFEFRPKHEKYGKPIKVELENGSLLVMRGPTQRYWEHRITKDKKLVSGDERINLTFRHIFSMNSYVRK